MSNIVTYKPDERPDVEVMVDGTWYDGELRQWTPQPDGSGVGNVTWHRRAGEAYIDNFSSDCIRKAPETTRSAP